MPDLSQGSSEGTFHNYSKYINQGNKKSRTKLIGFFAIVLLIIAIPITVVVSRLTQETRQRASVAPFDLSSYTSCGNAPVDVVLIIDKSGSMNNKLGSGSTKLAAAKTAASKFVDTMAGDTSVQNQVGLATFSTTATLNSGLTNNFSSVKTQINSLSSNGNTCTECGIATTNSEIGSHGRSNIKKVVILLTDGIANTIVGKSSQVSQSQAEANAVTAANNGYNTNQTTFFTIGLGNKNSTGDDGINEPFLQKIAADTGGKYYYSPSTDDLDQIYQNISQLIGKGSITGTVFNDANNNGVLDNGEQGLHNWTVSLKDSSNINTVTTTQSASDGTYTFAGVCNQSYAVSETLQSGWTQTSPTNPNYYPVTIANGNNVTDKNFGNTQATPTPTACVTPMPIKDVQIICTNCASNQY